MGWQRLLRSAYGRASELGVIGRPLDAVRRQPLVRAFARRHVDLLLGPGSTWANVDGSLRLLAEDDRSRIVFAPWPGGVATELLYWVPFVRWAQEHFSLDPARLVAVSGGGVSHWYAGTCDGYVELLDQAGTVPSPRGAAAFGSRPVLELVERYRSGSEPPRPLLKRARHVLLPAPDDPVSAGLPDGYLAVAFGSASAADPRSGLSRTELDPLIRRLGRLAPLVSLVEPGPAAEEGLLEPLRDVPAARRLRAQHALAGHAAGVVASDPAMALLAALAGVPVIALRSEAGGLTEADLDLALRVVAGLGGSLTALDRAALEELATALGGGPG